MAEETFDYKLVAQFTTGVLNAVLNLEKVAYLDKNTLNLFMKIIPEKEKIANQAMNISIDILSKIETEIKKICIDLIGQKLTEKQDPQLESVPERLKQYKGVLNRHLGIIFGKDKIPWIFDHIIETINLQCSEFTFVTLYTNKLTNQFNDVNAYHQKVYSQMEDIHKTAKTAIDYVNEAVQNTNNIFEQMDKKIAETEESKKNIKKAIDDANKAAEDANKSATDASKKITETSVTVLGMFSGIVITIVAGLFYSSSVLDNINAANFYRLISTAAVVGFVCYHLVALMFRCIDKFRDPNTALIKKDRVSLWVSIVLGVLFAGGIALQFIFPSECKHELPDEWSIEQEATCTEVGSKYKQCQVCEKIVERETISLLEHVYVSFTIQTASCTEEGVSFQKCVDCGVCETPVIIPAIGHNYEEVIMIPATATEAGEKRLWCATCNALTEPIVIPPYGE